jgi:hypothetical protein
MQFEQFFQLADVPGERLYCGAQGVFAGGVAQLKLVGNTNAKPEWRPRPTSELNRDLSKTYGLPIDSGAKVGGLSTIARALSRGDIALAQIATVLLRIPDPPVPARLDGLPSETGERASFESLRAFGRYFRQTGRSGAW